MRGMRFRGLARCALPVLWTVIPAYGFERLAEYYFLKGDPTFYALSGPRLEVFIVTFLGGSVAAGLLLKEFRVAAAVQEGSLLAVLTGVYYVCAPRVCYSSGGDGLEPLRLGVFLGSVVLVGAALGAHPHGRLESSVVSGGAFVAIAYYPVIFDFAGTKLLQPFHPWGGAAVLLVAAFAAGGASAPFRGRVPRFLLPMAALALTFAVCAGIAISYLPSLAFDAAVLTLATAAGSTAGALIDRRRRSVARAAPALWGAAVLLVLVMTAIAIPDAVSGVVPTGPTNAALGMGTPVYVGGYMDAPLGHAEGASLTVSFAGTDPSAIQADNYIAAGLGLHSAGCCVDGIDFAYRFDAYLFRGGNESLVASGWEVCDDNIACGGHSWKILLLSEELPLGVRSPSGNMTLRMQWSGNEVVWSYSLGSGGFTHFTDFEVPSQENPNFNTGVAPGGSFTAEQSAAYFYQFGVSSRYPIGHGGWSVGFYCPSIEVDAGWGCIQHAGTVQGSQSFWKVLWRWGEEYPNVSLVGVRDFYAQAAYSAAKGTGNFQKLW